MCEVCTEAVHSVALWTRVTLQLWTCVKCMYRSSPFNSVALWTRVTGYIIQPWTCVKYVPKQSIPPFRRSLNTGYITALDMCEVCTEAVHSAIPSQFEHGLHYSLMDMCEVCTEGVHPAALWTRVTLQLWTCVKYAPKQSIPPFRSTLNTGYITALDMCEVCTEAVRSVALWTRVTLQLWTYVKYVPKQSIP